MFCRKCGRRIQGAGARCPACNAEIPEMEYCSGFWVELNQNLDPVDRGHNIQRDTNSPVVPGAEKNFQETASVDQEKAYNRSNTERESGPSIQMNSSHHNALHKKSRSSTLLPLIIGEAVLLLILFIFLFQSGARASKQIDKLNAEIDMLEKKLNSLEAEKTNPSHNSGESDQTREEYSVPGYIENIWFDNNSSETEKKEPRGVGLDQDQPSWGTGTEDRAGKDSSRKGPSTQFEDPADEN